LRLGHWTALLNLDPAICSGVTIVGLHLVGEVLDNFAVAHEKKVVVVRHDGPNLAEEDPHVFVAVTLTGRVVVGRRTAR
jgi:hypothetical protein